MARTQTQEKTGYSTSPSDHQPESQAGHKTAHDNSGQAAAQGDPKEDTSYKRAMQGNRKSQENLEFLQQVNSGRADNDSTMKHLTTTADNGQLSLDGKAERLHELNDKNSLDDRDSKEYRLLLWEAHRESMNNYRTMGLSEEQTMHTHHQMLGTIRDAVSEKKDNFENGVPNDTAAASGQQAATGQAAATGHPAFIAQAQADDAKTAAGATAAADQSEHPQATGTVNDFWTRRSQRQEEERLAKEQAESKNGFQPEAPAQASPSNDAMNSFLTRWANRPPPENSPDAGNAEQHNPQGNAQNHPTGAQTAADYLKGLSDADQANATRTLEAAVGTPDSAATSFKELGAELSRGEATEETTTQWMLSQGRETTLDDPQTELLRQLHDKQNLDHDEVKVYAHLLNQSAQNMTYHVASGDDTITQYIHNATTNMIQQKWMDNPPDRTAEDILNNLKTQKDEEETKSRWEEFKNIFRRSADQDGD